MKKLLFTLLISALALTVQAQCVIDGTPYVGPGTKTTTAKACAVKTPNLDTNTPTNLNIGVDSATSIYVGHGIANSRTGSYLSMGSSANTLGYYNLGSSADSKLSLGIGTFTFTGGGQTILTGSNSLLSTPRDFECQSLGYFRTARGTTGQRPGSPDYGMFRYNTTTSWYESYINSGWDKYVFEAQSQILTNKTLMSPVITDNSAVNAITPSNRQLLYNDGFSPTVALDWGDISKGLGINSLSSPKYAYFKTDLLTGNKTFYFPNISGSVDSVTTSSSTSRFTNKYISGSTNTLVNIGNSSLSNSTVSGVSLGGNLFSLSPGTGLLGSSYNGSVAVPWRLNKSAIDSTGTVASGVWHGTKIGLLYGGTNADLSGTGGTSQVLKQTSVGANITVGQLNTSDLSDVGYVSVRNYGAIGDGVANDSAAFVSALTAAVSLSKSVYVPSGIYMINAVNLKAGILMFGDGETSVIRTRNASNKYAFIAQTIDKWAIQNIKFLGYNATLATTVDSTKIANNNNTAIKLDSICQDWKISQCIFYGFKGYGIYWSARTGFNSPNNGGRIVNNTFEANYCGIYMGDRAEYSIISNNTISTSIYGVWNIGGNNKYTSNSIHGNFYGLFLAAGTNDSHGNLTGNDFNHNGTGLRIANILNGENITGNSFFACKVNATGSKGLNFTGNTFGANDTLNFTSVIGTFFMSNVSVVSPAPVCNFTTIVSVQCFNNFIYDGTYWNIYSNKYFWDGTNNRLGLNTATPANQLDVNGNMAIGTYAGSNSAPANSLIVSNNVGIGINNPTHNLQVVGDAVFSPGTSQGIVINQNANTPALTLAAATGSNPNMLLQVNAVTKSTIAFNGTETFIQSNATGAGGNIGFFSGSTRYGSFINTTGNLILQNGGTYTDAGQRLQVMGTAYIDSKISQASTVTAGGTTGNQTINKPTGTVNIAAAGTSVTVTNSLVTTSSIIIPVIRTNDATATGIKNVVPSSGSFVITLNAAATAEISIGFMVIN